MQLFHPQSHAVHISAAAVLWQDFGGLDEALPAGGALVVQTTTTTDVTTVTVRAANVGNGTLVFGGEMEVGGLGTWDSGVAVGQRHKVPWEPSAWRRREGPWVLTLQEEWEGYCKDKSRSNGGQFGPPLGPCLDR